MSLRRGWLAGSLAAGLLFAWLLTAGRADLFQRQWSGDFYDAQAHAFLDGRLDVPADVLGVEAFVVDGKAYMYFGPVPALLRLPVAAFTDRFDGRLTQVSMLVAFAVLLAAVGRLNAQVRRLLDAPARPLVDALVAFALGAGTVVLYLASRAFVYHEALLWGAALSLVAYGELVALAEDGRRRHVALACVAASLAFLTRASVGAGPVAALGVLALVALWRRRPRDVVVLGAAAAVPLLLYVAVNVAKFGTLTSVPFEAQAITAVDADRREFLAENDGTLFGLRFAPTTALAYARPDGLRPWGRFPWVTYPPDVPRVGGVRFDFVDRASSVPATMPALALLAGVGAVPLARRPALRSAVGPLVLGAGAGAATTLTIAFIAHRYLADTLPALVLLALVGLHWRPWRAWLAGVAAVGVVANLALGLQYQRLFSPALDEGTRAAFVGVQAALPGRGLVVRTGDALPADGDTGDLFASGDCDALYWHDGDGWQPLERTPAAGRVRARVTVPDRPTVALTDDVELRVDGDRVAVAVGDSVGYEADLGDDRTAVFDVAVDPLLGTATATVDGRLVLSTVAPAGAGPATLRTGEALETPTDLCERLTS